MSKSAKNKPAQKSVDELNQKKFRPPRARRHHGTPRYSTHNRGEIRYDLNVYPGRRTSQEDLPGILARNSREKDDTLAKPLASLTTDLQPTIAALREFRSELDGLRKAIQHQSIPRKATKTKVSSRPSLSPLIHSRELVRARLKQGKARQAQVRTHFGRGQRAVVTAAAVALIQLPMMQS